MNFITFWELFRNLINNFLHSLNIFKKNYFFYSLEVARNKFISWMSHHLNNLDIILGQNNWSENFYFWVIIDNFVIMDEIHQFAKKFRAIEANGRWFFPLVFLMCIYSEIKIAGALWPWIKSERRRRLLYYYFRVDFTESYFVNL